MSRLLVVAAILGVVGLALLFAGIPALQRTTLADRLRPYVPGAPPRGSGIRTAQSYREVVGPLASTIGSALARAFGVHEDVRIRLLRIHAELTSTEFRVRQVAIATWTVIATGVAAAAMSLPLVLTVFAVWTMPLLAFLIVEQTLAKKSDAWRRRCELELPIVEEQLAMLLSAGFSLGGALARVASRTDGCLAKDFRRVLLRVRHGTSESEALADWAELAGVPGIDRLVSVLRLHGETSDLGRLVSAEAVVARDEAHRRLLEAIERKAQAVWIPVTVAALVPGVVFLSVPFLHALSFFSSA